MHDIWSRKNSLSQHCMKLHTCTIKASKAGEIKSLKFMAGCVLNRHWCKSQGSGMCTKHGSNITITVAF